jgi:serine/threonine protein phosphatase PrpC
MLERFKLTYDNHPWFRRMSWGLLVIAAIGIFQTGGMPPRAWILLAAVLPQLSRLWVLRGTAIVLPVTVLVLQSLIWVIAWGMFIAVFVAIIRHWRQTQRDLQEFEIDLQDAHDEITQEQEQLPWSPLTLPARQKPPLVLSKHFEMEHQAPTQPWQRKLPLHLEVGVGWDVGTKRKHKPNEDSLIALQGTCIYNGQLLTFGLFVIADGMGGYAHGQDASYLAIQTLVQSVLPNVAGSEEMTDDIIADVLIEGVEQANQAVLLRSKQVQTDMGATITAALVIDTNAFVVNVGDSRTYLYRECVGLTQVTRDHSHVARLVAAGQIARDDIYTHPDRNQVYRGLGTEQDVKVDWFTVPLQGNDCLLLCSDGLWEMVRDPEIERTLKEQRRNPSLASNTLVRAALQGGGLDNISVIIVHVAPITV